MGEVSVETRLGCNPSFANGHDVDDVCVADDDFDNFFVSDSVAFSSSFPPAISSTSSSTSSLLLPKM